MTTNPSIDVEISPTFVKELKQLGKRFQNAVDDAEALIQQLENGATPGDQVPGVKYTVYKVRLKNSNIPKGKKGGYRVVYYIQKKDKILLVTIYFKGDKADIEPKEIKKIIEEWELRNT